MKTIESIVDKYYAKERNTIEFIILGIAIGLIILFAISMASNLQEDCEDRFGSDWKYLSVKGLDLCTNQAGDIKAL